MSVLIPIALNTFREARRNRVFYSIVFFAVALILFSVLFTEVTFVAQDRILRDVGFGTMNIFGVAMAIFLGIGMVNREIEKKTIYTVISKPVSRMGFVVGKFLGLGLTLLATMGLMLAGFIATLMLYSSPVEPVIFLAFFSLLLEMAVITAFAVLCSTSTSSTLSGFFTMSFFIIGHLVRDIRFFGAKSPNVLVQRLSSALTAALPDLEKLSLKASVTTLQPVDASAILASVGYAAAWCTLFLGIAVILFRQRDLR